MTTKSLERVESAEEQAKQPEEVEKQVPENTDELVPLGEDEEKSSLTDREIAQQIEDRAQSIAGKASQTYQDQVKELTRKNKELNDASGKRQREVELARREGEEIKEWGDTPEVKDFQRTRREQTKEQDDFKSWFEEVQDAYVVFQGEQTKTTALKLAIQYGLEDGEKIVKQLEGLIKEISEGKNESDMELRAMRYSLRPKDKSGEKKHVPDSSIRSAHGGRDIKTMSADDKVSAGLGKLAKKN